MSNLKKLRSRVSSIKSTRKITKAMQLISASKLNKSRETFENAQHHTDSVQDMLFRAMAHYRYKNFFKDANVIITPNEEAHSHLIIIITTERGLCSGFNSYLLNKFSKDAKEFNREYKNFKIIIIGKKGYDLMKKKYSGHIYKCYEDVPKNVESVAELVKDDILQLISEKIIDSCYVYFNHFKTLMSQIPSKKKLFPVVFPKEYDVSSGPIYEFEGEYILDNLIQDYLTSQIYSLLLENKTGEEGARMIAMDNATKNATKMIQKLTLVLNRTRQSIITTELIEIISAAEALQ